MSDIQQRITTSFSAQDLMKTLGTSVRSVENNAVRVEVVFSAYLTLSKQHCERR